MSNSNCRNWFGGDLVIENKLGVRTRYPSVSYSMAVDKVAALYRLEPEKVKWAMYYPYPTDLKAHLLED